MPGYMYILECADKSYYTGSTIDLNFRLHQHFLGEGPNYTRTRLPVKLVYYELFDRIDYAFDREKQVQGWSRKKKEALINRMRDKLPALSRNYTQFGIPIPSASLPDGSQAQGPVILLKNLSLRQAQGRMTHH